MQINSVSLTLAAVSPYRVLMACPRNHTCVRHVGNSRNARYYVDPEAIFRSTLLLRIFQDAINGDTSQNRRVGQMGLSLIVLSSTDSYL